MEMENPNIFEGIRFYLAGFNSVTHNQVKTALVGSGGVYFANYSPDCTHVIINDLVFDDPICVAARKDGKALVTSLWVEHSIEAQGQADISYILYRPPKELTGIPGAEKFVICLTGYNGSKRADIMTMVGLMGAEFSKKLVPQKATHLICFKFEGDKYVVAKKWPTVKFINHQWLEDCLKAWEILPEEHYCQSSYELEMMETVVKDSEEETGDISARPTDRRSLNGNFVQKPTNALDNSVTVSTISNPSVHRLSNNVRKDEVNNDEQNVRKTPMKSGYPLHVGEESGNLSGVSSKRSADSLTDYSNPLNPRKTAKRSNVSEGKSGCSNIEMKEYLESDEVRESNLEVDKVKVASAGVGGLTSKELSDIHAGEGQCASPQLKQLSGLSEFSRITPKSKKLMSTASKRIDASKPATPVSDFPEKSKIGSLGVSSHQGTETAKLFEDKSCTAVPSTSLGFENPQVDIPANLDTRASPISGNVVSCASSSVNNKKAKPNILPENASFSPELKKLKALKSGNPKLNSDDQTGSTVSKPPRKKMVARRTWGSRPKVSKKTADAPKGALSGKFSNDDAAFHLTARINGKDHANPQVADKIIAAHTVDESNALESEPLQDPIIDINDYTELSSDNTETPLDFVLQYRNSVTELTRAKTTSGMLHRETDEAEMTDLPFANTNKQRMELAKQNLAQKKGVSERGRSKSVISAPKEVVHDINDDVGGKASKEKEGVKGQTMGVAGKKGRRGQSAERPVQLETKPVASDDPHVRNGGKRLGSVALKKRRETLLLNKSDTPVKVGKDFESALDKNAKVDGNNQAEKPFSTSNSSERLMGFENESFLFAGNGLSPENCVKYTGKKRPDPLISAGEEKLAVLDGKLRKLTGKSKDSIVGDDQASIKSKKIAGKKRRGAPVVVEKENEFIFHDDEVKSKGETPNSKNLPAWFLVSGHRLQRKEFQQLIKRLKGKHCRDSHQWSYQATHFIVPDPIRRTEKFFAAAASGRWILKTDYLTASIQAGKFLPEEPYEWHRNGLSEDGAISLEAPRKWRLLREKTGHGAFYGMRIVVYGECIAPPLDTLKRAVKAGDGTILATSPPYTRLLNSGVDFAIVVPGMPRVDMWVQEFLRHEIPCVSPDYLVAYVCKPGYPLDRHVQYNTHEWAAKSFARLSSLSIESVDDAATPENQVSDDLACQVCGSTDRAEVMLVCGDESGTTGCGIGTHIDCCDPPLEDVPDEDWFCPKCRV